MIRVVLLTALALAAPFAAWKLWRLFGPREEIKRPPSLSGSGPEPPWLELSLIGVGLAAVTLTLFILLGNGTGDTGYSAPQAPDWVRGLGR